jgi:hypothetical protein
MSKSESPGAGPQPTASDQQSASAQKPTRISAVDALNSWARQRAKWLQTLVFQTTNLRRKLTSDEIDVIFDVLERECGLKSGGPIASIPASPAAGTVATFSTLAVREIRDITNVNALAAGQTLRFGNGLTVYFGENACGKSGFVRVIKWIAGSRSAEDILPNIFTPAARAHPSAVLLFEVDGHAKTVTWNYEKAIDPLTAIQVFDGPSAAIHLDDDLTYAYTPAELQHFDFVQHAVEATRERLEAAIVKKDAAITSFGNALPAGSLAESLAKRLDHNSKIEDIAALAELTSKEKNELADLPNELEALRASASGAEVHVVRDQVDVLTSARAVLETIAGFSTDEYSRLQSDLSKAIEAQIAVSSAAFEGLDIPKVLEANWQALIRAGEAYIQDAEVEGYPHPGSACIYCRQELANAASHLVRKYREYCNNSAQRAVAAAKRELALVSNSFLNAQIEFVIRELRRIMQYGGTAQFRAIVEFLEGARAIQVSVREQQLLDGQAGLSGASGHVQTAASEIARLSALASGMAAEDSERRVNISEKQNRLTLLQSRSALGPLLPGFREFIDNGKWLRTAATELDEFTQHQRTLTTTAKNVSEKILDETFEAQFRKESVALRAPDVKLSFPGRQGKVIRQKGFGTGHKLSTVMSEGEQKVVALADFLAELSLRPEKVPVVFDDPVTSLDYNRIREVAGRIGALSKQTQVAVFTHNIYFVAALMDSVTEKDLLYFDVRKTIAPGYISVGSNPRIDSWSKIRGRINAAVQDARKLTNAAQQDEAVEVMYDHIRSACEVLVEQELLMKVTERFRPNVRMTVLEQIKYEKLREAVEVIAPIFEKACRFIPGHSQPIETLGTRPNLADLEKDWQAILDAKKKYDD